MIEIIVFIGRIKWQILVIRDFVEKMSWKFRYQAITFRTLLNYGR